MKFNILTKIQSTIHRLKGSTIIQFGPPRSGTTLIYNILKDIFNDRFVEPRHYYREKDKKFPTVATYRHPLDSISSSILRYGLTPTNETIKQQIIEFEKVLQVVQGNVQGNVEQLLALDKKIKTREDLAKCLLKQGKFKDASVILGEANKLRDELSNQKRKEEKEEWAAEASATIERLDKIIEEQKEKPKPIGKGFEDPFPNMSEDDYVGPMEFEFRNLIVSKLMRFTNWEKDRVPQDVWERAVELKKTE